MATKKIAHKIKRFIEEYTIDFNGTQAAIRAGYSKKTAYAIAGNLLKKVEVKAQVDSRLREMAESADVLGARIINEYKKLAFLDIRKAFDADGVLLPIHQIDDDTAAAISGVEAEEIYAGAGEDRMNIGRLSKIKLSDKRGALDSLAKINSMFIDRSEITGPNGGPIETKANVIISPEDAYKKLLHGKKPK